MLVQYTQPQGSVDSPGNTEVIGWDSLLSPSHTNSIVTGSMIANGQYSSPPGYISEKQEGTYATGNLLKRVNYVSLPPSACCWVFTVLFLEWQIRKLFILNDSQGKNQVANFPEGVMTDRGWRPRVILLKRYDLKVIL